MKNQKALVGKSQISLVIKSLRFVLTYVLPADLKINRNGKVLSPLKMVRDYLTQQLQEAGCNTLGDESPQPSSSSGGDSGWNYQGGWKGNNWGGKRYKGKGKGNGWVDYNSNTADAGSSGDEPALKCRRVLTDEELADFDGQDDDKEPKSGNPDVGGA